MKRINRSDLLGLIVFAVLILVAVWPYSLDDPGTRSPVIKTYDHMLSIRNALVAYRVANDEYPAPEPIVSSVDPRLLALKGTADLGVLPASLTTPIAYLERLPKDPIPGNLRRSYVYYRIGQKEKQRALLISAGSDNKFDIVPQTDFRLEDTPPSPSLIEHTYDPTNGIQSGGDRFLYLVNE